MATLVVQCNGINFATEGLCPHAVGRRVRTDWLGRGQKCQFDTRYENDGLIVVWCGVG